MPVTIKPSPELEGRNSDSTAKSVAELVLSWMPPFSKIPIMQSSFHDIGQDSTIIPYGNGMVKGIIRAFQQDLHLVLRPDDVWLSILTQFSMFVNGNAEDLRALFVAHEGQKKLVIDVSPNSVWNIDMGKFAQEMTRLIQENVVDAELREWIITIFSTTTNVDNSVAAVVMMGTLQSYCQYILRGGCGFPSVTLLGEKADWEIILDKVQQLPKYGNETTEWCRRLTPIVKHMIESFDVPNSHRIREFWLRACYSAGEGSGDLETLSGWVTAFCFWSDKGTRNPEYSDEQLAKFETPVVNRRRLTLGKIAYPIIASESIPKGVVSVPVAIQDLQTGLEHTTTMFAGSVGMTATAVGGGGKLTKVQPRSGWWMVEESVKPISPYGGNAEANVETIVDPSLLIKDELAAGGR